MSISFSGLGSGLDYSTWIEQLVAVKQQGVTKLKNKVTSLNTTTSNISSLKSKYSSLLTSVNKLTDSKYGTSSDVFAQTKATSSNEDVLTVATGAGATAQNLTINVSKLASNTTAQGANVFGSLIDGSTKLSAISDGSIDEGSFSFFVDNKKYSINVEGSDDLDTISKKMQLATKGFENLTTDELTTYTDEDIQNMMNSSPDILNISVADGKFSIDAGSKSLSLGTAQDKSNLATILSLRKDSTAGNNKFESSFQIRDVKMNEKLLGANSALSGVTAGDFTIGNATFTIDENTTLGNLISKINSSTDSGVSASVDSLTGELTLTSKTTGAFNISMENGSSNFLEKIGLMSGDKLNESTQTLGDNAVLTINGKEYESFSNTISSETTGLKGITLNLNEVSETGKNVKVKVSTDTDKTISAITDLVDNLNNVLTQTKSTMSSDSSLKYEFSLNTMTTGFKSAMTTAVATDGSFKTLADIGITTGAIGTSVDADISKLVVDKDKLKEALAQDPEAVKKLLIGSTENGSTGAIGSIKTTLENSLNATDGYFVTKTDSISSQIEQLNTQITRKQEQVDAYKTQLTKKFQAMDSAISSLQNQYSNFLNKTSSS
ncbi:MAG: flagellar filament capping protein FliD [Candidatus Gastranaerophilales bacterium]|nr:flagellar filament capping protein FliD [Candidatus Gastranaerophilales bacterium]